MTNTSTEAGVSVAPMGLLSRFIGVVTSPKATFEAVVAHPRWLGMLALVTIIVALGVSLPMTTEAGRQAALDNNVRQMENFGVQVNDEMYANMAKGMRYAVYQTFASILFVGPIISVILAGILYGVFAVLMGGQATFKQLFAVYVHSTAISAVGQLFTGPLNYFRGSMSSATNLGGPAADDRRTLVHRQAARHDRPLPDLVAGPAGDRTGRCCTGGERSRSR